MKHRGLNSISFTVILKNTSQDKVAVINDGYEKQLV